MLYFIHVYYFYYLNWLQSHVHPPIPSRIDVVQHSIWTAITCTFYWYCSDVLIRTCAIPQSCVQLFTISPESCRLRFHWAHTTYVIFIVFKRLTCVIILDMSSLCSLDSQFHLKHLTMIINQLFLCIAFHWVIDVSISLKNMAVHWWMFFLNITRDLFKKPARTSTYDVRQCQ